MPFALIQSSLEAPAPEKLARAFRSAPSLTSMDGVIAAKDAFGILLEHLPEEEAAALRQALAAEGVMTEVVDESELIPLPPFMKTRRAGCDPERMTVCDALGRPSQIEWPHVAIVAAGDVSTVESVRVERRRHVYLGGEAIVIQDGVQEEKQTVKFLLDLFLDVEPPRYHFEAGQFLGLGSPQAARTDPAGPLREFVRSVAGFAKGAVLNRGARAVAEGREPFLYPSRHAFEEETRWLLWRNWGRR